jgi:hypothetical protein
MKEYQLRLESLRDIEIGRIECLLARDTRRSKSALKGFLRKVSGELRREDLVIRTGKLSLSGSNRTLLVIERWLRMIRGPMFARNNWNPWSPIRLTINAEINQNRRDAPTALRRGFAIEDDYFNWLLVRAVANKQVRNFIECALCGNIGHVGIARANVRFCSSDHRSRYHYLISRRGAKDLLESRRKWRAQGIPCSIQDISILRSRGINEGSATAKKLLAQASLPLYDMDSAELTALHRFHTK